ncbi:MAG TPA: ferritin-like domain-containing protein [Streptosporangiaceae bacterium]|nr:ferritin-like domain-containing protein [Streptosporangiaceae bacterium]
MSAQARGQAPGTPEPEPISRRLLLAGGGGLGLGLAVSACAGSPKPAAAAYAGEFRAIALAAALENQAVAFYRALLAPGRPGKLGASVPALISIARTCVRQHTEHARAWNAVLRSARKPEISGVPLSTHESVMSELTTARTPDAIAAIACRLETQAAQTFASGSAAMTSAQAIAAAASIAPVEAMHAAILRFLLGEYPVPGSFAAHSVVSPHELTL